MSNPIYYDTGSDYDFHERNNGSQGADGECLDGESIENGFDILFKIYCKFCGGTSMKCCEFFCLTVGQVCSENGMKFTLRKSKGFIGRIYIYLLLL